MSFRVTSRGSLRFDGVSEDYDRTRGLPDGALRDVVRLLTRELSDKGPCLEIGVGTGRIAVPLWDAGVTMTGVDLSEAMLAKLVAKTGGGLPFPIALADATQLPFKDQCFGSAIACHVLHLIPDWRRALVELVRAIRPGGVVLVDLGGWGADWRRIADRFCEIAGIPKNHRGANDVTEVDEAMLSLGAHPRALETVKATVHESLVSSSTNWRRGRSRSHRS